MDPLQTFQAQLDGQQTAARDAYASLLLKRQILAAAPVLAPQRYRWRTPHERVLHAVHTAARRDRVRPPGRPPAPPHDPDALHGLAYPGWERLLDHVAQQQLPLEEAAVVAPMLQRAFGTCGGGDGGGGGGGDNDAAVWAADEAAWAALATRGRVPLAAVHVARALTARRTAARAMRDP
ncbi:hypothetical protein CXG81DRAFT_19027, partial [Caulochytrium protostelioides]